MTRIIGLLALTAVLSACNAIKLGYNNLDEVAYWWLDSYIDFTDDQAPRVREDLNKLHLWHRTQELPQLITLLGSLEQIAPGDVTASQACAFVPRVEERLNAVTERALAAVVALAQDLSPEQLQQLERKYEKNNADFRKDWIRRGPVVMKEKRLEQLLERTEGFYGRLGEPQRAVLRAQIDQSAVDAQRILADRQRRQQDALQTLRKLAGKTLPAGEAGTLLRGYLERARHSPDLTYRSYGQGLINENCRTLAALHNSTTPEQRLAAVKQLRTYQKDLRELAARQ